MLSSFDYDQRSVQSSESKLFINLTIDDGKYEIETKYTLSNSKVSVVPSMAVTEVYWWDMSAATI